MSLPTSPRGCAPAACTCAGSCPALCRQRCPEAGCNIAATRNGLVFFSCSLFFKWLLKAPAGAFCRRQQRFGHRCVGGRRREGRAPAPAPCPPALTLGSMIFHPLALSCWSSANFMLTSSMESCSRSQKPARSWKVGTGKALGSCGDKRGRVIPTEHRLCCPPAHQAEPQPAPGGWTGTHHVLLAESVKLLHLLGHEELGAAHGAPDLLQD